MTEPTPIDRLLRLVNAVSDYEIRSAVGALVHCTTTQLVDYLAAQPGAPPAGVRATSALRRRLWGLVDRGWLVRDGGEWRRA